MFLTYKFHTLNMFANAITVEWCTFVHHQLNGLKSVGKMSLHFVTIHLHYFTLWPFIWSHHFFMLCLHPHIYVYVKICLCCHTLSKIDKGYKVIICQQSAKDRNWQSAKYSFILTCYNDFEMIFKFNNQQENTKN